MWRAAGPIRTVQVLLVILSISGFVFVHYSTSVYGPGISPDSIRYVSLAENIASGKGFTYSDGRSCVVWPPLFPGLLAVGILFGADPVEAARFLNAVTFALIIFASGQLFRLRIKSPLLVLSGAAAVLLSLSVSRAAAFVWSEPVFILLIILFVIYISKFLADKYITQFILACFFAALSCLQRYIGITLVLTGAALILFFLHKSSFLSRLKYAVLFCAAGILPVGIWLMRNYSASSTLTGNRYPSDTGFFRNSRVALAVMAEWFGDSEQPLTMIFPVIFGLCVLFVIVNSLRNYKACRQRICNETVIPAAGGFSLIYTLFLIISATFTAFDSINQRLLSPVYVPAILVLLVVLQAITTLFARLPGTAKTRTSLVYALFTIWLISYPGVRIYKHVRQCRTIGVGGYNTVSWQQSPTVLWLKARPLDGQLYSNECWSSFLVGVHIKQTPAYHQDITEFRRRILADNKNYLIWYTNCDRPYLYNINELSSIFKLTKIKQFSDAAIYLME